MSRQLILDISEAYQDMIQALHSDMEAGSHWLNNLASDEFDAEYPKFVKALHKLYEVINDAESKAL